MQVAVVGGSGVVGSYTVKALRADGHSVRVLTRRTGVNVVTGEGLESALAGVDVVVDTLNNMSIRRSVAAEFFTTAARRIQDAAHAQGVEHVVLLSILGIDRVRGYGYYDAKLAQEDAARAGAVPVTVLRAAQFHEFPAQLLARLRIGPVAVVPHVQSQPVAARTVGRHLAQLAALRPVGTVELAGPEVHDIADLARKFVTAHGERVRIVAVTAPGKAASDMCGGALLATDSTSIDGPTYDEWLRSSDALHLHLGQSSPVTGRPERAWSTE